MLLNIKGLRARFRPWAHLNEFPGPTGKINIPGPYAIVPQGPENPLKDATGRDWALPEQDKGHYQPGDLFSGGVGPVESQIFPYAIELIPGEHRGEPGAVIHEQRPWARPVEYLENIGVPGIVLYPFEQREYPIPFALEHLEEVAEGVQEHPGYAQVVVGLLNLTEQGLQVPFAQRGIRFAGVTDGMRNFHWPFWF